MDDPPFITELRRTLIDFPERCNYQFKGNSRKLLRKCLFRAISCDGAYFDWFFPEIAAGGHDSDTILKKLQEEAEWSYLKYDTMVSKELGMSGPPQDYVYHPKSPCARIFRRGEPIYKCLTCGYDDACAMCLNCYQPEQHKDHMVFTNICQRESGGLCDCGDPEAWVREFNCLHSLQDERAAKKNSRALPKDLESSFEQVISILLDYVIDVMSQSDSQLFSLWSSNMNTELDTFNCDLDPSKYGYPHVERNTHGAPSDKYSLIVYNDQVRHFRDAVQRIHLCSKKVLDFAQMVAEQVQSHGRATVIKSRDVKLLIERQKILSATGLASCIRNARDEFREDMCHEIILWITGLAEREWVKSNVTLKNKLCHCFCSKWNIGLFVSSPNERDEYCKGKFDSALRIPNIDCLKENDSSMPHWSFKPSLWDVSSELCKECGFSQDASVLGAKGLIGTRFQYMIYMDIRFWKSIRYILHDFYLTSLITNLDYKKLFAFQYVEIYPAVADMFLSIDGEPEVNVLSKLSSQLFTSPSNSSAIISHGDVSRLSITIYNFLTTGRVKPATGVIDFTNSISISSLKNRRWGQIFFDIGYILSRGRDHNLRLANCIVPMACDILSLFQGKPVMIRETENHVEYESSDYTAFFHSISVIYQFAYFIAQFINNLDESSRAQISQNSIAYVIRYLLNLEKPSNDGVKNIDVNVDYGQALTFSSNIIQNQPVPATERKRSFLHPIHSFLSWLIEVSRFETSDQLLSLIIASCTEFNTTFESCTEGLNGLMMIFEYPIQTLVLSSQIKSGYWVRNGFNVKSQLQLYKNTTLREQGFLRDLFLVQVFAACCEPDLVIDALLENWLLHDNWNREAEKPTAYDVSIRPYMVEEFVNFLIHMLTEDVFLRGLSPEKLTITKIENEIIHNLCFGPLTYSKLCSQIPEHICLEKKFDNVLERLTTFKKPLSTKDSGNYFLKDAYIERVNPFYFNYSMNKKDDALKFLKERLHKALNKPLHDISISPKFQDANEFGMFKHVGNFTTSNSFVEFLIKTIDYIEIEGVNKMDSLLEALLHLIHICALEQLVDMTRENNFFSVFCRYQNKYETSLASYLFSMLSQENFEAHKAKIRAIFKSFGVKHEDIVSKLTSTVRDFDVSRLDLITEDGKGEGEADRKKRLAKDRQAKLLAKFKKQQSSFSKANNVLADCSDTDMEELEEEGWKFPESHCILCQDTAESAGPFGIITYISKSSEFRDLPFDDEYWFLKAFSDRSNLNESQEVGLIPEHHTERWITYMEKMKKQHIFGPGFADQTRVRKKLVSSTCGHGMHFNCYMQFLASNKSRSSQITRNSPDSAEHREFLCPLCKAINNMFIPILWTSNNRSLAKFIQPQFDDTNPFDILQMQDYHSEAWLEKFSRGATKDLESFSVLSSTAKEMIGSNSDSSTSVNQQQFRILLTNMFQILSSLTFPQVFKADSPSTLVNSIKSTEISLRGTNSSSNLVIYQLSNNSLINLRALNEFRMTSLLMKTTNWIQPPTSQPNAHLKVLSNLQALTSQFFNHTIIYADFFELLVSIFPCPSNSFSFNDILSSCFIGIIIQHLHLVSQELIAHDFFSNQFYNVLDVPYSELITESDADLARGAFHKLGIDITGELADERILKDRAFGYCLFSMILKSVTPFLRQAAIYAYVCCSNIDSDSVIETCSEEISLEANALCSFLRISTMSEILRRMLHSENSWESRRFTMFVKHLEKTQNKGPYDEQHLKKQMEYPGVISLTNLPERLENFFTHYYYSKKHQNPCLTIDNPAICLFCGKVVDAQKGTIGSPNGQCYTHFVKECNNTVGIFLLPKDRCLLLLHKNGGSFHDAPYLDQHGELSSENKRWKTVELSRSNYDEFIRNSWLQHNIPNLVVRKLDSVIDAGGWDTI